MDLNSFRALEPLPLELKGHKGYALVAASCEDEFYRNIEILFPLKRVGLLFSAPFSWEEKNTLTCINSLEKFIKVYKNYSNWYNESEENRLTKFETFMSAQLNLPVDRIRYLDDHEIYYYDHLDFSSENTDINNNQNDSNLIEAKDEWEDTENDEIEDDEKETFDLDLYYDDKYFIDDYNSKDIVKISEVAYQRLYKMFKHFKALVPSIDEHSLYEIDKNVVFIGKKTIDLTSHKISNGYNGFKCLNAFSNVTSLNTSTENLKNFTSNFNISGKIKYNYKLLRLQEFLGYIISNHKEARKAFVITCNNLLDIETFFSLLFSPRHISQLAPDEFRKYIDKGWTFGKFINTYNYMPAGDKFMKPVNIKKLIDFSVVEKATDPKALEYISTVKLIFLGNELPAFAGDDLINFNFCTTHIDFTDDSLPSPKQLSELLLNPELSQQFLSWMIIGLERLVENDYVFTENISSENEIDEYGLPFNKDSRQKRIYKEVQLLEEFFSGKYIVLEQDEYNMKHYRVDTKDIHKQFNLFLQQKEMSEIEKVNSCTSRLKSLAHKLNFKVDKASSSGTGSSSSTYCFGVKAK